MTQDEAVSHLQKRALAEVKGAKILFEKQEEDLYGEVLFHCHLALELALAAPFTHDLGELAKELQMLWKPQEREDFDEITDLAILSRYGDEKWYADHATKEKADVCLRKT